MDVKRGTVYLVGAGPGDPGLLTVRAAGLIAGAGAIVYDALANPVLLEGARADAELLYAGKRAGEPSRSQDEINRLLVELAGRHRSVVRLKGGDPFVFGRGGEEALALAAAGVPFEVVPGITAGIAAPAYAGIPVTHRKISATVTFATGHQDPGREGEGVAWAALVGAGGTLVLYMGVDQLEENLLRLREGGAPPDTPAAAISLGTYPGQRTVTGSVATLAGLAKAGKIGPPAVVVVGGVCGLRDRTSWFEKRPLFGARVVVTRARAQASGMARSLRGLGAEVIEFPTIRVEEPEDRAPLDRAVAALAEYDWLLLTSANGVEKVWASLRRAGRDARALAGVEVCALGPATAAALKRRGVVPELVPERYVAESVVEALAGVGGLEGAKLLLASAAGARSVLPDSLRRLGAHVVEVAAYQTVPDGSGAAGVRRRLEEGSIDLVTFTAGSTVRNFVELVGVKLGGAKVATIGPVTSATARELGLPVHLEPGEYTVPGLIRTVREYWREKTNW